MKKYRHLIEYLVLKTFLFIASILPWKSLPCIAGFFGFLGHTLPWSRSRLVSRNLLIAFPDWKPEKRKEVAKVFWKRICFVALEAAKAISERAEWMSENVIIDNHDVFRDVLSRGKGAIIHTGHFGNWELSALGIAQSGYPLAALVRNQKNPYVDEWMVSFRSKYGCKVFGHHDVGREILTWAKKGGIIGILMDHNLYKGGIFVDFFKKPAATTTITALLHLKLGAPIIGVRSYRKDGKCRLHVEEIDLSNTVNQETVERSEKVRLLTQALTDIIETWVREDPANWLWGHNRWKRQPVKN
ncbi:lysophospholipid acyltransferase family protein [Elusimicrobiota bacterium]